MGRKNKGPEIRRLLGENVSYNEIVRCVPCSKSTVNYYAKQMGMAELGSTYQWKEVQVFYDKGNSRMECRARFGFSNAAWTNAVNRGAIIPRERKIPIEDLLVHGRLQTSRSHIKWRLLQVGLLINHCYECSLTEWRGNAISLHLHHINGDGADNRLENLTLLCPNCHSQTENFAGKNISAIKNRQPKEKNIHVSDPF